MVFDPFAYAAALIGMRFQPMPPLSNRILATATDRELLIILHERVDYLMRLNRLMASIIAFLLVGLIPISIMAVVVTIEAVAIMRLLGP